MTSGGFNRLDCHSFAARARVRRPAARVSFSEEKRDSCRKRSLRECAPRGVHDKLYAVPRSGSSRVARVRAPVCHPRGKSDREVPVVPHWRSAHDAARHPDPPASQSRHYETYLVGAEPEGQDRAHSAGRCAHPAPGTKQSLSRNSGRLPWRVEESWPSDDPSSLSLPRFTRLDAGLRRGGTGCQAPCNPT